MTFFSIRPVKNGDEEAVVALLHALAEYERLLDRFHITADVVRRDYLCDNPAIFCDLLFEGEDPAGIATWYWTYGSFAGARKLFLADLFVRPEFRGKHYGQALIGNLARRVAGRGWCRHRLGSARLEQAVDRFLRQPRRQRGQGWIAYNLVGEALTRRRGVSTISLVLAMADNGVIGKGGAFPWRIPEDMRRFKALTMGKPCIMGRKTWESLPRKPLPGRTNIVVTRDCGFRAPRAPLSRIRWTKPWRTRGEGRRRSASSAARRFISAALPHATLVHLTEVHGDARRRHAHAAFRRSLWRETAREDHADAGRPALQLRHPGAGLALAPTRSASLTAKQCRGRAP